MGRGESEGAGGSGKGLFKEGEARAPGLGWRSRKTRTNALATMHSEAQRGIMGHGPLCKVSITDAQGVIMTAADAGLSKLDVIGPPDTAHYIATVRSSVVR